MINEEKKNGTTPGDIQQSRQRKTQASSYAPGQSAPGVTETTNAQGNRSFSGHRQAPKPGGIDVDLSTGSQLKAGRLPPAGNTNLPAMADQQRKMENTSAFQRWETPRKVVNAATESAGLLKDLAGAAVAVPADAVRNKTIEWAGGDPATTAGGATQEQDRAFGALQNRLSAFDPSQGIANLKGGILEATGAQPVVPTKTPGSSNASPKPQSPGKTKTQTPGAAPTKTNSTATTTNNQTGEIAGPPNSLGIQGIIEGRTADGVRSFSGFGVGAPNQANTIDMGFGATQQQGRSSIANPNFDRAIAAGNLEEALQSVNRADSGQMERLGALQGQYRRKRDMDAAQAADSNYNTNKVADVTAQRMIRQAEDLASRGFSKGAQRLVATAGGLQGLSSGRRDSSGIAAGIKPEDIASQNKKIAERAAADRAEAEAISAQAKAQMDQGVAQQQGILQGLVDRMGSPDTSPEERQALTKQYQALKGGSPQDHYLMVDQPMGYDAEGKPVMGRVAIDPTANRVYGGRGNMPSARDAAEDAIAQMKAKPENAQLIRAMYMRDYGVALPDFDT